MDPGTLVAWAEQELEKAGMKDELKELRERVRKHPSLDFPTALAIVLKYVNVRMDRPYN